MRYKSNRNHFVMTLWTWAKQARRRRAREENAIPILRKFWKSQNLHGKRYKKKNIWYEEMEIK